MSFEWPMVTIGDVAKIKHGFAFKGEFFIDEPSPNILVTPGNFAIGGGFQPGKSKYYAGPLPDNYVLRGGEIVITMTDLSKASDTLGYAAKVPTTPGVTYWHNQRVGLLQVIDDSRASKDWLHYLMRTREYRSWVIGSATGTTVKHSSPSRIESFPFKLPPLEIQCEIAATLGALDDRIDNLRATNATLEAIAQAIFKSWFIDFDPVRAKMEGREPEGMDAETAALFPSEFEESELGLIPRGWREGRLFDLVELKYGKSLRASDRHSGQVPVYGSGGITGWHDEAIVNHPTVIVGRKGSVGTLYWEDRPSFPIDTTFFVSPKAVPLTFCYYTMIGLGLDQLNTDAAVPGLNRDNAYGNTDQVPSNAFCD